MTDTTIRSIQTRLFILLLLAFTAAVLFIVLFVLAATAYFLISPSNYNPLNRITIVTRLETFYLVKRNWQGVEILPQTEVEVDFHRFWERSTLINAQGMIVLDHGSNQSKLIGTTYTKTTDYSIIPITVEGKVVGSLILDSSYFPIQRQLSMDFLWPVGVISFLMAIPTIIIGLFLMRRFVTPLAEVIAAARTVASGDLTARVHVSGPDDLRVLSDSFNHMAISLEQSDSERRNMLADIAHELRTPLTVMRGRLEGIMDGIYSPSPEQISPALEETYLMERLVDDLHLLTLAETRQLRFEHNDVNMSDIAAYVIDLFKAQADDKKIKLTIQDPADDAIVVLDPQRFKQAIGNLVSNALRYTPDGGCVKLFVEKTAGMAVLTVSDNGPGVPHEDIPNIFMRFWRGEKSRSRASGGAGLGLAIARQLVEAQGGIIHAENQAEGGLKISIKFPLKP